MIRNKKAMLFCSQIILTGALITGAPCLASGAEIEVAEEDGTSGSVFGSSATTADSEEVDHSGEGQIHKPSSLEVPDFTSDPDFVDDSTDNTYGYYTIMGDTTVSLAQMTSQYEEHGAEYPSASLKDGGAATIDDFCTIILEEANAEGKLCGDVDYAAVEPIVDAITPVPGGVGSVTTSVLVGHVVEAAMRKVNG